MADLIIAEYAVKPVGWKEFEAQVETVTGETKKLQTQIQSTFSDKSIEEATQALYEQGDVMGALINKYGNATSALKAMEKELATMAALGQRGTKEFQELSNATAELKDSIGDTRNEIKKMASDTRVFDTMVQGARGITAAFSVATGVAAAFGQESEDLQKAILKVQGAMAALQGVQELAKIATEEGGIATKAYGVALQVVDKISKVTGLSMAASWALATGGITLVIGALTSLYFWYKNNQDAAAEFEKEEADRQERLGKAIQEGYSKSLKAATEADKEFERQQQRRRQQALLDGKDADLTEIALLEEKQKRIQDILKSFNLNTVFLGKENAAERKKALDDMLLDVEVALKKLRDKTNTPQVKPVDNVTPILTVEPLPLVTQEAVDMNKKNVEQMMADFKQYGFDKAKEEREKLQSQMFGAAQDGLAGIAAFASALFAQEGQALDAERERQLLKAGDDSKKREKIEKDFAIKKAKIERDQAIANKVFASFDISLRTAQAIMRAYSDTGPIAGAPLAAIAAAIGALQLAAVAAQPLPAIPQYERGGPVPLVGGKLNDGHLYGRSHREGGILINAQGGEYIWNRETTQKHADIIKAAHENRVEDLVLHKYVVPMMRNTMPPSYKNETYDDSLLRSTIRHTSEQTANKIVKGISKNITDSLYITSRYNR